VPLADDVVFEVLNIIDDHSRLCVASRRCLVVPTRHVVLLSGFGLCPGFGAALCKTYADLLRRQRTAASPFVQWSRCCVDRLSTQPKGHALTAFPRGVSFLGAPPKAPVPPPVRPFPRCPGGAWWARRGAPRARARRFRCRLAAGPCFLQRSCVGIGDRAV
jgi:hypothetical protein